MSTPAKKYSPARYPSNFSKRIRNSKRFVKVKMPLDTLPPSFYTGKYRRNDYPQVWYQGRSQGAHVVAWKKKYGDNSIPKGHIVHHRQGDKSNPSPHVKHLQIIPRSEHSKMEGSKRYNEDSSVQS